MPPPGTICTGIELEQATYQLSALKLSLQMLSQQSHIFTLRQFIMDYIYIYINTVWHFPVKWPSGGSYNKSKAVQVTTALKHQAIIWVYAGL